MTRADAGRKSGTMAKEERYKLYANYRLDGTPALRAFSLMRHTTEPNGAPIDTFIKGVISAVIGCVIFQIMLDLFPKKRDLIPPTLWIESPSGETIREFPFLQGMRIIKKKNWDFAVVRPIQPPRVVSRREALSILMFGDKGNESDKA